MAAWRQINPGPIHESDETLLQTGLGFDSTCAAPALRRRRASGALVARRGLAAAGMVLDVIEHVALQQLRRGQRSFPPLLAAATCIR